MPKINLAQRPPIRVRAAIVPVRPATMRTAMCAGVDPYNSRDAVQKHWERYAHMCGAVRMSDAEVSDVVAALDVPAILRMQAE